MHNNMLSSDSKVKIFFPITEKQWHDMSGEWLWADRIGDNLYRIDNIPLYVYGISYMDFVACRQSEEEFLEFERVVDSGGHSTYRTLLKGDKNRNDFLSYWIVLEKLGCSYESSIDPEDVFSIDVPPHVDVRLAYDILLKGESDDVWHLDEGNFEHGPARPPDS